MWVMAVEALLNDLSQIDRTEKQRKHYFYSCEKVVAE